MNINFVSDNVNLINKVITCNNTLFAKLIQRWWMLLYKISNFVRQHCLITNNNFKSQRGLLVPILVTAFSEIKDEFSCFLKTSKCIYVHESYHKKYVYNT